MVDSIKTNLSWLTAANAVTKPLWLLFIIVLCVRVLGDVGYGVFTATLFLSAIIAVFTDWGFTQYSIREVSREPGRASVFLSNMLTLQSGLSIVAIGLTLVVGYWLGYAGDKIWALLFASLYTVFQYLTTHLRGYYRAVEVMKLEAVSVIIEKALVITVGTVLLFATRSVSILLAGMALSMFLTFVGNLIWIHRRLAGFDRAHVSTSFTRATLVHTIPLGLAAQFVMIYLRTDGVMVDAMIGEADAGRYGLAFRVIEATYLLPGIVTSTLYPRLSAIFAEGDTVRFVQLARSGALWLVAGAVVIAAVFIPAGHFLIRLLAGDPAFLPATGALQILAGGLPFMFANYMMSITLTAADDQRRLAVIMGVAATLNVAANLILIPGYSFYGAAVATVGTELVLVVTLLARVRSVVAGMKAT